MSTLPTLVGHAPSAARSPQSAPSRRSRSHEPGVVFAVYAPFGTDPILSRYPNRGQAPIGSQPLVRALRQVAAQGINVSALVDLYDDDSYLVEIPAGRPRDLQIVSAWKQDMSTPQALAGFLQRAHQRFPCSALILALEGHGAGFVPEIDPLRITADSMSFWDPANPSRRVRWTLGSEGTGFEPDTGAPPLPMTSPELPMTSPELPAVRMPLSNWGLAAALARARRCGVPRPAIVHFNNCFNMSVELLHTVAPYADYATGYANYNFFTAGASYPDVFRRLRLAGSATAAEVARWFAEGNHRVLLAQRNHPTVGATARLSDMRGLGAAIDKLSLALTAALRADRPTHLPRIQTAVRDSLQFDTQGNFDLEVPDQHTDLGQLATRLRAAYPAGPIHDAAVDIRGLLAGVKQYGDFERPYRDQSRVWDFRDDPLGVSIFLPDPDRTGVWDWRSPYYLAGRADPALPPAHKHQIPFLSERAGGRRPPWVEFIVEYHNDVPFKGLLRARAPEFPVFDRTVKSEYPPPGDDPQPNDPKKQR